MKMPEPYTFVCPSCTCASGDDAIRECNQCGLLVCEDCVEPWDDVIGNLCRRCRP